MANKKLENGTNSTMDILTNTKSINEHKGQKHGKNIGPDGSPRLNATFDPDNYEYLRIMATLNGVTMTRYLNIMIEKEKESNKDTFEQAKELMDKIRN